MLVEAAVRNNLDGSFRQLQVNQDAVVEFGVPDTKLAEHHDCTLVYKLRQRRMFAHAPEVTHGQ